MTTARRDETGCGQVIFAQQQFTAWMRVQLIRAVIVRAVAGFQCSCFEISQDLGPELHAVTDGNAIRMGCGFLRTRLYVQSAQDDLAAGGAVRCCQLISSPGKGQMDADSYNLRKRVCRRR